MNIPFVLNGSEVVIQTNPEERLVTVLREDFHLLGTREGCLSGHCGACTIFFNKKLVPSCLVKMYQVIHSEVMTIEGFSKTEEYKTITKSFKEAGVQMCGYCNAGKILIASTFLDKKTPPEPEEIKEAFKATSCRCTNIDDLILGVSKMFAPMQKGKVYDHKN